MTTGTYQPLFLKYRPQQLNDILGQDSIRETLINAITNNKIVHAYLLTGPRGSGKTSTARIIAKSLNCNQNDSPTIEPCGQCESCTSIANSSSIDVTEIDAASHGHVEDARNLIERVNLASVSGKYRIYIIDEVHMLTTSAFNALLKVIEEPPSNVIFILATTEVNKVPKTIASRCQQLKFKPISVNDCINRLRQIADQESINIEDSALKLIAKHSDGAMRDALSLLDQLSVFSNTDTSINEEKVLEILGAIPIAQLNKLSSNIIQRQSQELVDQLDNLIDNGKDTISICQELSNHLLALLEHINNQSDNPEFTELIKLCQESNTENFELVQIIDSLSELELRLKQSTQSKNLLRAWLVKIAYRAEILVVKDLMARIEKLENGSGLRAQGSGEEKLRFTIPKTKSTQNTQRPDTVVQKQTAQNPEPRTQNHTAQSPEPRAQSFLDHLSPGSKGMFISSQAQLTDIEGDRANLQMPSKFKFLKSKLEDRSQELCTAISKDSGQEIHSINIEVVEQLSSPTPVSTNTSDPSPEPSSNVDNPIPDISELSQGPIVDSQQHLCEEEVPIDTNNASKTKLDEVANAGLNIFGGKEL